MPACLIWIPVIRTVLLPRSLPTGPAGRIVRSIPGAAKAEFSDEQVSATCQPLLDRSLRSETEAALIEAIDQLCHNGTISDKTRTRFEADWTPEQQLEILALCGT